MVCYCCVKGCKNNSNLKKKDPNYIVSFHAFPTNSELRLKWLRAIGRPSWEPPTHTRICSAHFRPEQISHESCRTRIKDDACPVNALPLNSNFEASDLEVCRICLATDVNMNSLQEGILKTCMESIGSLNENHNIEGLPQFVCNECAAHLLKFYRLVERSIIAQATLLDIFAQHGEITKNDIKCLDRKKLKLASSLNYSKQTNIYDYTYNYVNGTSCIIKSECNNTESKTNIYLKDDSKDCFYKINTVETVINLDININQDTKDNEITSIIEKEHNEKMSELRNINNDKLILMKIEEASNECIDDDSLWEDYPEESVVKVRYKRKKKERILENIEENKVKTKCVNGLTPDEFAMQDYFDIVKLSVLISSDETLRIIMIELHLQSQEQIEEWQKSVTQRHFTSETTYSCEICSKEFAHINTYRMHSTSHDPRRGKAECPVCKLRFKNEVLVKSHRNRTHGKKFYCKSCPKVFNNVAVAKKHHRWHSGSLYTCTTCEFASAHESAVRVHARAAHAHRAACATCGRACLSARGLRLHCATAHGDRQEIDGNPEFRCNQCDINFVSEGARRVHILTSSQHKKKPSLCDTNSIGQSLKTTCSKCGEDFQSQKEVIDHMKTEHRRSPQKKTSWSLPGDSYPTQCEHCGEMVNNRKEHWWHVRKQHPREKHMYQPVITAICETCGKGFQNSTKLHLHELRHAVPRVECAECGRVFYDKYALARHATTHGVARPHACRACPRTFRLRASLHRHARVHSAVTPYECTMCGKKFKYSTSVNLHVRTVHYKLPHPPRKKRSRTRDIISDTNNANIV